MQSYSYDIVASFVQDRSKSSTLWLFAFACIALFCFLIESTEHFCLHSLICSLPLGKLIDFVHLKHRLSSASISSNSFRYSFVSDEKITLKRLQLILLIKNETLLIFYFILKHQIDDRKFQSFFGKYLSYSLQFNVFVSHLSFVHFYHPTGLRKSSISIS